MKEKRLVAVGEPIPYRFSYYGVTARSTLRDERAEVFLRWLKAQAAATEAATRAAFRLR
ncbi:MAG TPA: hypothetical protein VN598_00490 [Usitatibacter sp.]|nr:hypothetical protein [Usitatibacter sp.]